MSAFKKKVVSIEQSMKSMGLDQESFFGDVKSTLKKMDESSTLGYGLRGPFIKEDTDESPEQVSEGEDGEYGELSKELMKRGVKDPKSLAKWLAKATEDGKMAKWMSKQKAEGLDVVDVLAIIHENAVGMSEEDRVFLFDQVDLDDDGRLIDEAFTVYKDAVGDLAEATADPADEEDLDEAIRIQKLRRLTGSEKAKAKRERKKRRGAIKRAARLYRKRNKRKIKKRMKRLQQKFGGAAGLAKKRRQLSKSHKRLQMAGIEDELANLKEQLESDIHESTEVESEVTVCEEAAIRMGLLTMRLGEVFEVFGDEDVANVMYEMSDRASDLSERIEGIEESDMSEEDLAEYERLAMGTAKALEAHEKMGAPTIWDAEDNDDESNGED